MKRKVICFTSAIVLTICGIGILFSSCVSTRLMVWSGSCVTPDPVSSKKVHDETIGLVVKELSNVAIISQK